MSEIKKETDSIKRMNEINETADKLDNKKIKLESPENLAGIFGSMDENIRIIEEGLRVRIRYTDDEISIEGEAA
ncbi:MAG: hypothetical protein PHG48_05870, partial [Eubacteriales bacterium]|nr:hypothetical protein [Eubacteriales bacterium]